MNSMKRFGTIALLLFLLSGNRAEACKCSDHLSLDKAQCDLYDVIFTGKLDSVSVCHSGYATGYFSVQSLYKGKCYEQVSVRFDCESDCQMSLLKDEQWLVYADTINTTAWG